MAELKPEKRTCPHCGKEMPREPLSEEAIMAVVKIIAAAEVAAAAIGVSVSAQMESLLRIARDLDDEDSSGDLTLFSRMVQ